MRKYFLCWDGEVLGRAECLGEGKAPSGRVGHEGLTKKKFFAGLHSLCASSTLGGRVPFHMSFSRLYVEHSVRSKTQFALRAEQAHVQLVNNACRLRRFTVSTT